MKKRSARPGDSRNHERRFGDRQTARGEDDDNLATREGRPVQLPLAADAAGEVAEEVEGNALAEGITSVLDALRPHLRAILMGLACLLLAAISWMWLKQQRAALVAKSWDDYMFAVSPVDPAALAEVATQHPGTPAGEWADLIQAEMALDEGAELLFVDRDRATPRLQAAADGYAKLLLGREKGLLGERATFGLAKANECMGKIDEARAGYEAVASDYPTGALAGMARQRVKSLEGERGREWYTWFAAQRMTPPAPPADTSPILGVPSGGGAAAATDPPPQTETPAADPAGEAAPATATSPKE